MLRIRNLVAGYGDRQVIRGLSLHVQAGEIVAIIGANGAGKTTLLKAISGILRPRGGEIELEGRDLRRRRSERIVELGLALVPEGRALFPSMTVAENLRLGAYGRLRRKVPKTEIARSMDWVHSLFPRLAERSSQFAGSLSGGEQQMLAIGRALMSDPRIVMFDEPSMGLAPLVIKGILSAIGSLREAGKTILVVEQNARAILKLADRGYVMETGSLILEGSSEELLANRDVQRAYLGKEYSSIAE